MNLQQIFNDDSIDKQLNIAIGGATYTNAEFGSEEMTLTERLCSEDILRFGCCEASTFQIRILNTVMPLKGKTLTVSMALTGEENGQYMLGKYKVDSDKPTADRRYRDVVAYDAMYDILTADVSDWYHKILPDKDSSVTLRQFRNSFLSHFGIEQEAVELVNDSMTVAKTVEPSSLSGKTVITAICEINGCFGHIGRDGRFRYIHLKEIVEGLYPSDTLYPREDLYPADPMNTEKISRSHYISAEYEDFRTERINKLQIRQEENDIGCIYGDGDNCYIVQDNFLVYGKSSEELNTIAANLYSVICKVWYRPAHVEAKGNPCLEVGDGIRLSTTREIIHTYILQRTLKGIQALRDTYDAEGERYQSEDVNSVHESIIQLKGKTNVLTRTVEETNSRITDVEAGLSTRITQNAGDITLEAQRAAEEEGKLSARIKVNADSITSEVNRATKEEGNLSSKITQTADSITAEVKRATEAEGTLSSRITQTAEKIETRVEKGQISSLISQEAGEIYIRANRLRLESDYFRLSADGTIEALAGKIANMKFADYHMYWDYGATSAGMSALTHGSAFWAGASFENRDNAPFRVWHDGTVICEKLQAANYVKTESITAINGEINKLKVEKLSASEFTADNISAMNITVKAANITGTLSASQISAGMINGHSVSWQLKPAVYKVEAKTVPLEYMGSDGKTHTTTVVTGVATSSYNLYLLTEHS